MSFSASTCLTYTGTTPLGGFITIYSNVSGIPIQTGVPLADLTGPNCPYIIEVPDGTTSLTLVDIPTYCEVQIPIVSSDFCVTCDLDFDIPLSGTVGVLSVGNLTGSCENPITDYLFTWYGPDSLSTSAFTSAPSYSSYPHQFNHPLTGTTSPPVLAGTYTPILEKIVISGYTFTPTVQNGTIIANLDCFGDVTVSPYTCDNGTGGDANYTHRLNYTATNVQTAQPLKATFNLSATTNYFPYQFKAESIPDNLKIKFSGSAYSTPLLIEDVSVGLFINGASANNFNTNVLPKSADTASTAYFKKVICLTALTINPGDYLILEVTPNTNPQTNWDFYFGCLESFDCSTCLDNYENTPYKILLSSVTGITGTCDSTNVSFTVSGCSTSALTQGDFYDYFLIPSSITNGAINTNNSTNLRTVTSGFMYFNNDYCDLAGFGIATTQCRLTQGTGTIKTKKYVDGGSGLGNIELEFTNINDFNAYYNSYKACMVLSGSSNNLDYQYYRYFDLYISKATGTTSCGDGVGFELYRIHPTSLVTTGTTGGGSAYTMSIVMQTIPNAISWAPCDINCTALTTNNIVNVINVSSTATTNNFTGTTTVGARYESPFTRVLALTYGSRTLNNLSIRGTIQFIDYQNRTYVYSGSSPSSIVPSLSAKTCNNFNDTPQTLVNPPYSAVIYGYAYRATLTNPLDPNDFQIWASPINNYTYSGYPGTIQYELIYDYSGGTTTVINPSYFY
jgi:hypothetical protein